MNELRCAGCNQPIKLTQNPEQVDPPAQMFCWRCFVQSRPPAVKLLRTIQVALFVLLIACMFLGGDNPGRKPMLAMQLTLLAMCTCAVAWIYLAYRANHKILAVSVFAGLVVVGLIMVFAK